MKILLETLLNKCSKDLLDLFGWNAKENHREISREPSCEITVFWEISEKVFNRFPRVIPGWITETILYR